MYAYARIALTLMVAMAASTQAANLIANGTVLTVPLATPEPASIGLTGVALLGLLGLQSRRLKGKLSWPRLDTNSAFQCEANSRLTRNRAEKDVAQ